MILQTKATVELWTTTGMFILVVWEFYLMKMQIYIVLIARHTSASNRYLICVCSWWNSSLQNDYTNLKIDFETLSKDFNNSIPLAVDKLAMLINMGKERTLKNEINLFGNTILPLNSEDATIQWFNWYLVR